MSDTSGTLESHDLRTRKNPSANRFSLAVSPLSNIPLSIYKGERSKLFYFHRQILSGSRKPAGDLKSLARTCRKGGSFEAGTASEPADFRSTPGSGKARERRVRPPKQRARPQPGHLCRSRSADRHKTVRNHLFIKKLKDESRNC